MIYYSTFTSGAADIIRDCMRKYLKDYKEVFISNDIVIYNTDKSIDALKNLQFFNNTFVLIHFDRKSDHIKRLIRWSEQNKLFTKKIGQFFQRKKSTYWLYFNANNSSIAVSQDTRDSIEKHINRDTNLINRPDPQYEIWFQQKREGFGLIGIRITRKPDYQTVSLQGELRPEVSFLLNFVAEVNKGDTVLDPFCGSGSIGISCAKNFRYKKIINADTDISKIKSKLTEYKLRDFVVLKSDFTSVDASAVTKIITDPPWGISEEVDVTSLYTTFFRKFSNIKKIVILTSQSDVAKESAEAAGFKLQKVYKIYVGGQEAWIMKFGE